MSDSIAALAKKHQLSEGAVRALADALRTGNGGAQWSHPELGGMGQWSRGGMLQIGDMWNDGLKAKVAAVLAELAEAGSRSAGASDIHEIDAPRPAATWWPTHLGAPAATGAQNAMRYACFPDERRLAIERDGAVTLYDTGEHRLTGFAQAQSTGQTLSFTGPDGPVSLTDLVTTSH